MRGLLLTVLFLSVAVSWAQPVTPPLTLVQGEPLMSLANPRLCARGGDTLDVFFRYADVDYHLTMSQVDGAIFAGPNILPANPGWQRRIEKVIATAEGWAALAYETNGGWQQLLLMQGRDSLTQTTLLEENHLPSGGQWGNGSAPYGFSLEARAQGGCLVGWQYNWTAWISWPPPGWSEAGFGCALYVAMADWPQGALVSNDFDGSGTDLAQTFVHYASADSLLLLQTGNGAVQTMVTSSAQIGGSSLRELAYAWCAVDAAAAVFTPGGRVLLLSRATNSQTPRVVELVNLHSCVERLASVPQPEVTVSDSVFGLAWLSRNPRELYLSRVDTLGALASPAGRMVVTPAGYRLGEAALALASDGTLTALWIEYGLADSVGSRLRMVSLAWDVPLHTPEAARPAAPASFNLSASPNPFNSALRLRYELASTQHATLAVYNLLGQEVARLHDGLQTAGAHELLWEPSGSTGIYLVRLTAGSVVKTQKVVYLK